VALRNGYSAAWSEIGWSHPRFGAPTQMACFTRAPAAMLQPAGGPTLSAGKQFPARPAGVMTNRQGA